MKFKCATIAEAEMLAQVNAPDVLLAYQPVGPKVQRLMELVKAYPATLFSCLIDNISSAAAVNQACAMNGISLNVYIDLNVGMNRTGINPAKALEVFQHCVALSHLSPVGLHVYDGHIQDSDIMLRRARADQAFSLVQALSEALLRQFHIRPVVVAGGSLSFAAHLMRKDVECSPGTFVFWDWGYKQRLPDEPYEFAALVITRVMAIIDEHTICTDLGHKSVAAENPLPRVYFLNAPELVAVSQSEEHLVLQVTHAADYTIGTVLYGVPVHICPTVALYEKATVVENNRATGEWQVTARNRKISI